MIDLAIERLGVRRPDGKTVSLTYDLNRAKHARAKPVFLARPGVAAYFFARPGETLTEQTDGSLPIRTAWSGLVAGSVERTFEPDFLRPNVETVNGADPVAFAYDADGLLAQAGAMTLTRSAQTGLLTGTALGGVTTSQSYDTFGDLASFTSAYNGTTLLSTQLTRDAAGRVQERDETTAGSTDTYSYTYDPAGRLTDVTKNGASLSHYDYDGNGNRTQATNPQGTTTATYDAQDRLLQYGDTSYAYTANGELTARTLGGHSETYDYDELGNLRSVDLANGIHVEYVIDGANWRVGKKVNGTLVRAFLWSSPLRIAAELDGTGAVVSRFVYGTKANVPDSMIRGGVTYRLITDPLGSPRLVVNTADGTVAQRLDYDEFGQVILDTSPGFQPFGFAGGLYDAQTGLVRFGARDYDARVGRWTAKDPIRFRGSSTQLYSYALNNPENLVDPSGLVPPPPPGGPTPPGWTPDWEWRYPEGTGPSTPRWFDPDGGEWRWHPADKWHPDSHWDHNPWDDWNSPWRNVPHAPCPNQLPANPAPGPEALPWWEFLIDSIPDPIPVIINPCLIAPSLCGALGSGSTIDA